MTAPAPRDRSPAGLPLRTRALPLAAVLLALWGVVSVGLRPVFSPGAWSFAAFCVTAAMCLVSGAVATVFPRRGWLAVVLGAATGAALAVASLVLTGRDALWRDDPASAVRAIRDDVLGGAAPLDVAGPLADVLVAALAFGCALTLVVALALRAPLIAGLVPALLLLAPAAVTGASAGTGAFVAAGVLLALLAWLRAPSLTWGGPIAAVAAVAVAAAAFALVPPSRDRVWNTALVLGPVSSTVPDVTVALADDLRQRNDIAAFSFRSSEAGPIRFSLATLAAFEGGRWQPQDEGRDEPLPVDTELDATAPVPSPAAGEDRLPSARVSVVVQGLVSPWLPVPQARVQSVSARDDGGFDPREWEWTAESATARSNEVLTRTGMSYTARHAQLNAEQPEALALLSGGGAFETFDDPASAPEELRTYLELPDELPDAVRRAADAATAGAADRFGIPFLLQNWFRGGDFSYDESAPYEPGTDPDDPYAVMESFLEERSGFCVHYASTFAVMARSLGVPTRISVGYAANAAPERSITVRSTDLHAWPEVYFDDIGWVAFEPTPGVGSERNQPDDTGPDNVQPETPDDEETTQEPEDGADAEATEPSASPEATEDATPSDGDASAVGRGPSWTTAVAWALVALALLLLPAAVRLVRSRRRTSASERGRGSAVDAWREFRDTAVDLGLAARGSPPRARTPDAFVDALADRGILTGDALRGAGALVAAANAERFGGGAPDALRDEIARGRLLRVAVVGLRASASRPARVGAALAPRSLLTRAR